MLKAARLNKKKFQKPEKVVYYTQRDKSCQTFSDSQRLPRYYRWSNLWLSLSQIQKLKDKVSNIGFKLRVTLGTVAAAGTRGTVTVTSA